jgi:uncharacterized lipoprotein YddW (UPF0748 family)
MRKTVSLLILCFITILTSNAQFVKREFRGVWVATVANIDWPSRPGLSTQDQQSEIVRILDNHKKLGINAIILQVRPSADAIYLSELEPWTAYLSGEQSQAPDPFYDPLEYWITEAHKRGMELHAWFNPYRIKQQEEDSLAENHVIKLHPDWAFEYAGKTYFDPGNPEVWEFLIKVVTDVVSRYDIDAVHFDDYFYPYPVYGLDLPDSGMFRQYGGKYYPDQINDWRRHNVDTVIQQLSAAIKAEKPWVKFGISPFGVWRNRHVDPNGSETTAGTSNYDNLYADVIKWQREGWIDYLMPQLYWRDGHPAADFSTLAYWWQDFAYGRAMYYGLAPYRINRKSDYKQWKRKKYFLKQIDLIRSVDVQGFGYFSSRHFFRKDLRSLQRRMSQKYFKNPALVPAMPWIDALPPNAPQNLSLHGDTLKWESFPAIDEMDKARFFVVYKYKNSDNKYLKNPKNILAITDQNFILLDEKKSVGVYRISALDRLNNESQLSDIISVN